MAEIPRKPCLTDPDCPTSLEKAIAVEAVAEEYAYLDALQCSCGASGTFERQLQALVEEERSMFDRLDCECTDCGRTCSLFFNVDAVFAGYDDMFSGLMGDSPRGD